LDICLEDDPIPTAEAAKCIANASNAKASAEAAEYDLAAQQDMARWAFALLLVSATGTCVSIVGLFALFVSLSQTRTAIQDNRAIGEAQVRAYLGVDDVTVKIETGNPAVQVHFCVKNYGQSPARDFTFRMFVRLHRTSLESDAVTPRIYARENDPLHPKYPASAKYRIGVGRAIKVSGTQQGVGLTTEEAAFAKEGSLWVDLSFETAFVDVFGVTVPDTLHFRRNSSIQSDAENDLSPHSAGTHSHFASQ